MRKPGRFAYAVLGSLPQALGYVAGPVRVARSGKRHGWAGGQPSGSNAMGLVPMGAGAALIGWAIASHYRQAPPESRVSVIPDYLVSRGAYSMSRNPMYVGGALMWAGWAVYFGNARVAGAGLSWFTLVAMFGVPFEERLLRRKFGDAYGAYQAQVPRWITLRAQGRPGTPR
jgi:protein-S-isoprenylcysteine O-methyltransferase Ste14